MCLKLDSASLEGMTSVILWFCEKRSLQLSMVHLEEFTKSHIISFYPSGSYYLPNTCSSLSKNLVSSHLAKEVILGRLSTTFKNVRAL